MTPARSPNYLPVRADWIALAAEPALEPELPIVDAHHHLWSRPGWRYQMDDYLDEVAASGHAIIASVFMQCQTDYRPDGPLNLRPVGETESITKAAERIARRGTAACAGIVGHADLSLGAAVEDVLVAHIAAGKGRFRGVRHISAHDSDRTLMNPLSAVESGLLSDAAFREGFAKLAPFGLSFDAWLFHPQIGELTALAQRFPDTTIVLDHIGGILGIGAYAGRHDDIFASWSRSIRELADRPNVVAKIGGLGMRINGFGFERSPTPPSSERLTDAWRPYVETAIDAFGPNRCMFESNAPVDRGSYAYGAGWNAFKRLTAGFGRQERSDLFGGTARRIYRV